jgi:hypothetical protein
MDTFAKEFWSAELTREVLWIRRRHQEKRGN